MILRPIIDTDFVMRTWYQKLDDLDVRWYPGHWKLKDRKERERFQAKLTIPSDASDNQLKNYWNGQTFEIFVQKTLKTKSYNTIIDKGLRQVIMYFESQKDLHAALAIQQIWKLTESHSPYNKRTKSNKDKMKNSKSLKGKKAEPKGSTSSNISRDKTKKHTKVNDDTRITTEEVVNIINIIINDQREWEEKRENSLSTLYILNNSIGRECIYIKIINTEGTKHEEVLPKDEELMKKWNGKR
ncbi:hypothetical protein RhiirA4_481544 [Rhizophagus irregularis]|uniref:Uncharacterized protein n=1 Tax=Rhizophagus irregularis TaxID=588596 RepID=A0A2I1HJQ2_9GLOM|nr:hypothetical protein RhiirA4_481544 [Rhizophagus irregularis]